MWKFSKIHNKEHSVMKPRIVILQLQVILWLVLWPEPSAWWISLNPVSGTDTFMSVWRTVSVQMGNFGDQSPCLQITTMLYNTHPGSIQVTRYLSCFTVGLFKSGSISSILLIPFFQSIGFSSLFFVFLVF